MRFNENRFYYKNLLKKQTNIHCFLEQKMDSLCICIASCLRKITLPYYFFPNKKNNILNILCLYPNSTFSTDYALSTYSSKTKTKTNWHSGILYEKQFLLAVSTF